MRIQRLKTVNSIYMNHRITTTSKKKVYMKNKKKKRKKT